MVVIALDLSIPDSLLVLDDQLGRRVTDLCELRYTGTLGVLIKAKQAGYLNSIAAAIAQLQIKGMWLSEVIIYITSTSIYSLRRALIMSILVARQAGIKLEPTPTTSAAPIDKGLRCCQLYCFWGNCNTIVSASSDDFHTDQTTWNESITRSL